MQRLHAEDPELLAHCLGLECWLHIQPVWGLCPASLPSYKAVPALPWPPHTAACQRPPPDGNGSCQALSRHYALPLSCFFLLAPKLQTRYIV